MSNFYSLSVKNIHQETNDAISVTFDVPANLQDEFQYKQGQYLTLKSMIKDEEVRRAYSMCSSPIEDGLTVTVKRVSGGKMSNYIPDQIKVGDTMEVMPPQGRFYTEVDGDNVKTYYLFGAGSGITPLYSILKTILEEEPMSKIYLFYGNRDEDSIIFKDGLDSLEKKYAGQLFVTHVLSQPKLEKASGIFSAFKKGKPTWKGKVGRIDAVSAAKFLEENPARTTQVEYFICGPGGMIDAVEQTLLNRQIKDKKIHTERFTTNKSAAATADALAEDTGNATAIVTLDKKQITVEVPAGKTILDALIDAKVDPPYSCTSGACSTCMAKVTDGTTKMEVCYALDDDEVAEGYILTCQAHATSGKVELTFDV
ncbi:MAG: 2Fe-2S iron-sulfur cluster-binding protein [Saprospiraceae bacterium]